MELLLHVLAGVAKFLVQELVGSVLGGGIEAGLAGRRSRGVTSGRLALIWAMALALPCLAWWGVLRWPASELAGGVFLGTVLLCPALGIVATLAWRDGKWARNSGLRLPSPRPSPRGRGGVTRGP